ncbi:MAG: DUF6519 domain-containing protein [candidate division WOR-3 bacterium]|nr:DUF6519 domain-containing protein [candidate division WOR-3 bacterium]
MKGDFSRDTFDKKKHYKAVMMQQGRVSLDADWNEQIDIIGHERETALGDVIGPSGVLKNHDGFKVTGSGAHLLVGPGRIYVGGILCELETGSAALQLAPPAGTGLHLVYLDAWERHITAVEDPDIREKALGGPDTATRVQTAWQVKFEPVGGQDPSQFPLLWGDKFGDSKLKLKARLDPEGGPSGPCDLNPQPGYKLRENQLYRVEIHQATGGTPTYKWSRDNGTVVAAIEKVGSKSVTVENLGRDEVLGFADQQWVELLDDTIELRGGPGQLLRIIGSPDPVKRELSLIGNVDPLDMTKHPRVRRWDAPAETAKQTVWLALEDGIQVRFDGSGCRSGDYWLIPARAGIGIEWPTDGADPVALPPAGIRHHFCALALVTVTSGAFGTPQDLRPVFPALTDMTSLFYVGGGGQEATPQNPALGSPLRVGVANGKWPVKGARVRFEVQSGGGSLSGPGAGGVVTTGEDGIASCSWTLGSTEPKQRAVATLLGRADAPVHLPVFFDANLCLASGDSTYTLVLSPNQSWADRLREVKGVAHIGFEVGEFRTEGPIVLDKSSDIKITGAGQGTRVIVTGSESALSFKGCDSVIVRDLYVESRQAGKKAGDHLNGVLSFTDCKNVTVEGVTAKCASGSTRTATCITAWATKPDADAMSRVVRIRHCEFWVGRQQVGVLVVNPGRAQIEDNLLHVVEFEEPPTRSKLYKDERFLKALRDRMVSGLAQFTAKSARRGAAVPPAGAGEPDKTVTKGDLRTTITFGDYSVKLLTSGPFSAAVWETLIRTHNPAPVASAVELMKRVEAIAGAILADAALQKVVPGFGPWIGGMVDGVAAFAEQGIVVGGQTAQHVRILHNCLYGFRQGIHVGVSKDSSPSVMADRVTIADNTTEIRMSAEARKGEVHGVYVGNCRSLWVDGNSARLTGAQKPGPGIHVYGSIGPEMVISRNHLSGFNPGILVKARCWPDGVKHLWLARENVASDVTGALQAVKASGDVKTQDNVPAP